MSRYALCAAVLASLLIAACGGSGHSSSSASSTTSTTSTAATSSASTATSTVSAGPTTTTAATSSRPPEVPRNRVPTHPTHPPKRSKPTAPNTDVRIPAAFAIAAGAVTPPLISAPANVTIQLQLHNQDSKAHRVTLSVPRFGGLVVPAHSTTTTDVTGVPKGTYRLLVDGAARARIIVGTVPGP